VTQDVKKLAGFYARVLETAPLGSDEYAEVRTAGSTLSIVSKRSVDIFSAGAAEAAANRSLILDFEVADVDGEYRRLGNLVSEFVLPPTNQPWGSRSMLFRDPDGNLINFFAMRHGVTNSSASEPLP
jgi:uncharacterized glyoxalase superfamily protein PhnB